ncbi:hypothetical protein DFH06DRAFT_1137995 [Mycena polygramma]|nr:hypothetical protein DFH06DRAFT_1137995 [Mycena polygramma]
MCGGRAESKSLGRDEKNEVHPRLFSIRLVDQCYVTSRKGGAEATQRRSEDLDARPNHTITTTQPDVGWPLSKRQGGNFVLNVIGGGLLSSSNKHVDVYLGFSSTSGFVRGMTASLMFGQAIQLRRVASTLLEYGSYLRRIPPGDHCVYPSKVPTSRVTPQLLLYNINLARLELSHRASRIRTVQCAVCEKVASVCVFRDNLKYNCKRPLQVQKPVPAAKRDIFSGTEANGSSRHAAPSLDAPELEELSLELSVEVSGLDSELESSFELESLGGGSFLRDFFAFEDFFARFVASEAVSESLSSAAALRTNGGADPELPRIGVDECLEDLQLFAEQQARTSPTRPGLKSCPFASKIGPFERHKVDASDGRLRFFIFNM